MKSSKKTDEEMRAAIEAMFPGPDYMQPVWADCLSWAIGFPPIIKAFREETGNNWVPGKSPIERMIDEACGVPQSFLLQFVPWFNANVWGPMDAGEDTDVAEGIAL